MTLNFTRQCPQLLEKLNGTLTSTLKYKYEEIADDVIGFKMINENATEVCSSTPLTSVLSMLALPVLVGGNDVG